jgi:hypothetical protein
MGRWRPATRVAELARSRRRNASFFAPGYGGAQLPKSSDHRTHSRKRPSERRVTFFGEHRHRRLAVDREQAPRQLHEHREAEKSKQAQDAKAALDSGCF